MPDKDPNFYRDIHFGFQIARADNGYIFKEYLVASDSFKIKIAKDDDELAALVQDWAANFALALRQGSLQKTLGPSLG